MFWEQYLLALWAILGAMTALWLLSIPLKNVSIVDLFWGAGFVLSASCYFLYTEEGERRFWVLVLVAIWGLRLSGYLSWRNIGKGEDFRYRKFREDFGPDRYWWYSYPSVFLLQGVLMWLISAPLLGSMLGEDRPLYWVDGVATVVWGIGFLFEAGSDLQLARFKREPSQRGKLLTTGFWRYTRHPNYFGDACVWWGFGLFAVAAGQPLSALGALFMTLLIVKVSGVALLERSLKEQKPGYEEYVRRTSAFVPWFPKS